jgi:hypothetical protein
MPEPACSARDLDDDSGYFFQPQHLLGILVFAIVFQVFGLCLRGVEHAHDKTPLNKIVGTSALFVVLCARRQVRQA